MRLRITAGGARPRPHLIVVSVVLAVLAVALPLASAGAAEREVLRAVHTDVLHVTYEDGQLGLLTREGLGGDVRIRDPANLVFNLEDLPAAHFTIPDDPAFAFLGAPGERAWLAPETQEPDIIWPGWDTEALAPGTFQGDAVDLTLLNVEGPGNVEVFFNYDPFERAVRRAFSSTDSAFRTFRQEVGSHVHANWAFSALGTYQLTFEATALTAGGAEVRTGPVAYEFVVGPYTPPSPSPSPTPSVTPSESPTPTPTSTPSATPTPTPTTSHSPSPSPTTTPPPSTEPCPGLDVVLDDGHVDIAARIDDGAWQIRVKDGTRGPNDVVWRPLDKTGFHVRPAAKAEVPPGEAFAFLGEEGATIWQLPQTQQEGLLWPGWNTEGIDYSQLNGPVRWSLEDVEGPGKLAIFTFDEFGQPAVVYDSGETLPQHLDLPTPTHAHGNWAFTKEGIYRLTFKYTATTSEGTALSAEATLPVAVGAVDLADLCPGGEVPSPSPTPTPTESETPSPTPTPTPTAAETSTPTPTPSSSSSASPKPCVATAPTPTATPTSTSTPPPGGQATLLDDGHVDYAVRLLNGSVTSQVKDGTVAGQTTWRDPADVVFHVKQAAASQVPAGSGFAFLGTPGSTIWQIPQTQKAGILWLGWNTEELTTAQVNGPVTWKLDKVEGPGKVAIYEFDSFGQPEVIFDGAPGSYSIPLGTHAHGNWAFTKQGVYELTFTHTATLAGGATSSDTATVRFGVGDVDTDELRETAATTTTSTTQQTVARTSNGCALARTGGEASTPITAASVLLGAGALLTGAAAFRRRKTNR